MALVSLECQIINTKRNIHIEELGEMVTFKVMECYGVVMVKIFIVADFGPIKKMVMVLNRNK